MRSIMHSKEEGTCYLCMMLHGDYSRKQTQEHHVIFGRGQRKLSEKYGLKVYLCRAHHLHDGGPEAVHRNADISRMLCEEAQREFEGRFRQQDFREIFGRNYVEDSKWQQEKEETEQRIQFVEGPKYELDW